MNIVDFAKIAIFKVFSRYCYIETPSHMGDNSYNNIPITDASRDRKSGIGYMKTE